MIRGDLLRLEIKASLSKVEPNATSNQSWSGEYAR